MRAAGRLSCRSRFCRAKPVSNRHRDELTHYTSSAQREGAAAFIGGSEETGGYEGKGDRFPALKRRVFYTRIRDLGKAVRCGWAAAFELHRRAVEWTLPEKAGIAAALGAERGVFDLHRFLDALRDDAQSLEHQFGGESRGKGDHYRRSPVARLDDVEGGQGYQR